MDSAKLRVSKRELPVPPGFGLALAALFLLALALYFDTVLRIGETWVAADPTYQHGFAVLAVCTLISYRKWVEVGSVVQVRPSFVACFLLGLASCLWAVASLTGVEVVKTFSLVFVLALLPPCVIGFRSTRFFAFPIALLLLALPVWEPLRPLFQKLAALGAATVVSLTGIPVFRDGVEIHVPAGTFHVTPGCSGMAFLLTGALAGALLAHMNRLRAGLAVWIVLGAVAVAGLGNIVRIATVVTTGEFTDMKHQFVTNDHSVLGWGIFAGCLLAYVFAVSRMLPPARRSLPANSPGSESLAAAGRGRRSPGVGVIACLAALAVGPVLVHAHRIETLRIEPGPLQLPAEIRGWRAVPTQSGYRPAFREPYAENMTTYRGGHGAMVQAYVADYTRQSEGREAVSIGNSVYDGTLWTPVKQGSRRLESGFVVQESRIRSSYGSEKLVWQWYLVDGRATGNDYAAKLLNARALLKGDSAVAVIVLASEIEVVGSPAAAGSTLARFAADTRPAIEAAIERARRRD